MIVGDFTSLACVLTNFSQSPEHSQPRLNREEDEQMILSSKSKQIKGDRMGIPVRGSRENAGEADKILSFATAFLKAFCVFNFQMIFV
jgi:hypothetical protein